MLIKNYLKKNGFKGLLLKVGDLAVGITRNTTDDKVWKELKKVIKEL